MQPVIHILLASFNRSHIIKETLDSIKAQTYRNWKCFITDDNSTDETLTVVQDYIRGDKRFQFFQKPLQYKQGLSDTRNFGMDLARDDNAEYIQFFDDDDLMHPKKLELQIAPFLKEPHLNFTVCKYYKLIEMESGQSKIEKPEFQMSYPHVGDAMLNGNLKMNSQSSLWKMDVLDQFRFDYRLTYAEEWELFTRIGYHYPSDYSVVEDYLFSYRKHLNTLTMGKDENYDRRKSSSVSRIILMHYLTENRLHTEKSVIFMAKTFLIYSYNPAYVKRLLNYSKENKGFSKKLKVFLKNGLMLSRIHNKVITRMATWI